eukprot:TRINITY_DN3885_c0_g1_i8.p1 TRINITY_DN3885_c0_g1~~TRINITY_DN3885_c0_g1_i8.p1  ORF type:complete len:853 (+),score=114.86 TRINITY_DN3885_c0_g1_i8:74-2632(+)
MCIRDRYYFMKAISSFSPHFVKLLLNKHRYHTYIQTMLEHVETTLNKSKGISIESAYNLMRQSANALLLLHNFGIAYLDVKPASMAYDSKNNLLKLIDAGSAFTFANQKMVAPKFCPPEVVQMKGDWSKSSALDLFAVDAYCWAMSFYFLLFNKKPKSARTKSELGLKERHIKLIKKLEAKFNSLKDENTKGMNMKGAIKNLMLGALGHDPKIRLTMKKVVHKMKRFEKANKLSTAYAYVEYNNQSHLMKLLRFFEFSSVPEENKELVELKCGHKIVKDCLVKYALNLFLKGLPYKYLFVCTKCQSAIKLKSLPLACGCTWTRFGKKIEVSDTEYGSCEENDPLSVTDLNLLNDYTTFELAVLMLAEFYEYENDPALIDLLNRVASNEEAKAVIWALKSTRLITKLDLHSKILLSEDRKLLGEALKGNKSLAELSLEKEGSNFAFETLESNKTLKILSVKDGKIENPVVESIIKAPKGIKTLVRLKLENIFIGVQGVKEITKALKSSKTLSRLNLNEDDISSEGTVLISNALKTNKTLTHLSIDSNRIRSEGAKAVAEMLLSNKTLIQLSMGENEIWDEGAKSICESLRVNRTLAYLNLRRNSIDNGFLVAEAIKDNKALKELNLSNNKLANVSGKAICESLEANNSLTHLYIDKCRPCEKRAQQIFDALKTNKTLTLLSISDNDMDTKDIKTLAEVLAVNSVLTHLDLSDNEIKTKGAKIVSKALKVNKTLTALSLSHNYIDIRGLKALLEALEINTAIKHLNISYNGFTGSGQMINEMIMKNRTITHLKINGICINNGEAKLIFQSLKENDVLEYLGIKNDNIVDDCAELVAEMLLNNKTLRELDKARTE